MTRARNLGKLANTNTLSADNTNNFVGIASTQPTTRLNVVGVVSATSFSGDGSGLTGVANTENVIGTAITMTTGNITGNLTVGGVLTYDDVTNVDSVGIVTARSGIKVVGGGVSITAGGLHVTAGVTTVGGGLTLTDNVRAKFGTDGDLQIFHNGSDSFITDSGTGSLHIRTDKLKIQNAGGTETLAEFDDDGRVDLYHDNSKKLETSATGVTVTGSVVATSFEGSGADLTNLPASGDSNDITASLFI